MPQRENPTRNKKKKKVPGKMRQKSGSWQAEVPSAMGQPLTQDFPQSISSPGLPDSLQQCQGLWECGSEQGCPRHGSHAQQS